MTAVPYSSDDLLVRVRNEARLPDASDLDDATLLLFADEELQTLIGDRVKAQRGEHWVRLQDYDMPANASQSNAPVTFQLPRRAMGRMVRSVTAISGTGLPYPLSQIDSPLVGPQWMPPNMYRFRADVIDVSPIPGAQVRIAYLREQSALVPYASCAPIAAAPGATSLTLAGTWALAPATPGYCDLIRGDAPYESAYDDLIATTIAGTAVTLDLSTPIDPSSFPAAVTGARADVLCLRGQSPFPNIPKELFPALVSCIVRRVLEALKDDAGVAVAESTLKRRMSAAEDIISPRNEQGSKTMVRRASPLRSQPYGFRRWR